MVYYANIPLSNLRIIYNYIIYAFGKCAILNEDAVNNLGTGYTEAECGTYEHEKDKGVGKEHIDFWCIQTNCLLNFELSRQMCKEAKNKSYQLTL